MALIRAYTRCHFRHGGFSDGTGINVGRNFFPLGFNVGAAGPARMEILLDGVPNTTPDINRALINPPVDSVQEFKVQANSYDAEFGRTSGSIVTSSPSPALLTSWSAYDFERHSVPGSNTSSITRKGSPIHRFSGHQFGPIWVGES